MVAALMTIASPVTVRLLPAVARLSTALRFTVSAPACASMVSDAAKVASTEATVIVSESAAALSPLMIKATVGTAKVMLSSPTFVDTVMLTPAASVIVVTIAPAIWSSGSISIVTVPSSEVTITGSRPVKEILSVALPSNRNPPAPTSVARYCSEVKVPPSTFRESLPVVPPLNVRPPAGMGLPLVKSSVSVSSSPAAPWIVMPSARSATRRESISISTLPWTE